MTIKKPIPDPVKTDSLEDVLKEVCVLSTLMFTEKNEARYKSAYHKIIDLYEGRFDGYQACNTAYHDLRHTTDTVLALMRLIHGAFSEGHVFTEKQVYAAFVAGLFHDAGYILEVGDNEGTGAKFTADHVERSMAFIPLLKDDLGFAQNEVVDCQHMILCTDLPVDISTISFSSETISFLGKLLAVADLYAQMADRTYLEKLKYLYAEFEEGNVDGFSSESDLIAKTVGFYAFIEGRIKNALDGGDRFMLRHFRDRWNIDEDIYQTSIVNQKNYLIKILNENEPEKVFSFLKREVVRVEKGRK